MGTSIKEISNMNSEILSFNYLDNRKSEGPGGFTESIKSLISEGRSNA